MDIRARLLNPQRSHGVIHQIEDEPLGTGGAILKFCKGKTEPFLVSNGDTISPINYNDMMKHYIPDVTKAVDKKKVSAGIYIIDPSIYPHLLYCSISYAVALGKFSFEKAIIGNSYEIPWFTDLGTPESYNKVAKDWA